MLITQDLILLTDFIPFGDLFEMTANLLSLEQVS